MKANSVSSLARFNIGKIASEIESQDLFDKHETKMIFSYVRLQIYGRSYTHPSPEI